MKAGNERQGNLSVRQLLDLLQNKTSKLGDAPDPFRYLGYSLLQTQEGKTHMDQYQSGTPTNLCCNVSSIVPTIS